VPDKSTTRINGLLLSSNIGKPFTALHPQNGGQWVQSFLGACSVW
jgi:hypothetical protein